MEALLIFIGIIYLWAGVRFLLHKELLGPYDQKAYSLLLRRPLVKPLHWQPFRQKPTATSRYKRFTKLLKHP